MTLIHRQTTQQNRTIPLPQGTPPALHCTKLVNFAKLPEHHKRTIENRINGAIKELYGDQTETINEIKRANPKQGHFKGRRCEVLLKQGQPKGFIIYENELKPKPDISDSLKLCHLELMDSRDAGTGYRSLLFHRIEEEANERFAKSIHIIIAKRDPLQTYLTCNDFKMDNANTPTTRAGFQTSLMYYEIAKEKQAQPQTLVPSATADRTETDTRKRHSTDDDDDNHCLQHSHQLQLEHVGEHKKYRNELDEYPQDAT